MRRRRVPRRRPVWAVAVAEQRTGVTCVVRAVGLSKDFPGHAGALQDVDLEVEEGEALALIGPNGSGKSTLLKLLLGLTRPTRGHVELFGSRVVRGGRAALDAVGSVLEGRANVYERLSTYENARYYATLRGARFDRPLFASLCSQLGFAAPDSPVRRLSTGNRQRAALIVSLVHRPGLLLLDEPTLGLDAEGVAALEELLQRQRREQGITVINVSHDLNFVRAVSDRMVSIAAGRITGSASIGSRCAEVGYALRMAFADGETSILDRQAGSATFVSRLRQLQEISRLRTDIAEAHIEKAAGDVHELRGDPP